MVIIERLLQPAASAISEVVSDLLSIISRIITSWEGASRGAMTVFVALSPKVDELAKGARQQDGSGSVRADSPAESLLSPCTNRNSSSKQPHFWRLPRGQNTTPEDMISVAISARRP